MMRKNIAAALLFLAASLTAVLAAQESKRAVRRRSALVLESGSKKSAAAATGFDEADDGSRKGHRELNLFSTKSMKKNLLHGAKSIKKDFHMGKSRKNLFGSSKGGKSLKRHNCMAGRTGFTKIEDGATSLRSESKTITRVQDLRIGDKVVGLNDEGIKTDECEVVSVINVGEATTFGNYTYEHFVLSEDPNTLVMHGRAGHEGRSTTVYQVLSTCPVITDESGKESTFSLCARHISGEEEMISWRDYVAIHGSILKLVRATGVRDMSALQNSERAVAHLPTLCAKGLECAHSGDCHDFEAAMMTFAKNELVPEALANVVAAFNTFSEVMKKIPALSIISE